MLEVNLLFASFWSTDRHKFPRSNHHLFISIRRSEDARQREFETLPLIASASPAKTDE